MIRRTLSTIALAVALAATAGSSAQAATPTRAAVDGSGSYYVSISLPNDQSAAAILVLNEDGAKLSATLILEGSPAAELENVTRFGDEITADVNTSAGRARLTVKLADRSGKGSLVLLPTKVARGR